MLVGVRCGLSVACGLYILSVGVQWCFDVCRWLLLLVYVLRWAIVDVDDARCPMRVAFACYLNCVRWCWLRFGCALLHRFCLCVGVCCLFWGVVACCALYAFGGLLCGVSCVRYSCRVCRLLRVDACALFVGW